MDLTKNMEATEMVRCQVTGKLYPVSECEVVVVRIVKAKEADINSLPIFGDLPRPRAESPIPMRADPAPAAVDRPIPANVIEVPKNPAPIAPRKNIVPPHMLGVMIPQDHPQFERLGAKETRRV